MRSKAEEKREMLFLAVILVAATFLRFYRIGGQSYWVDELLSLGASSTPEGISFWKKILYDVHGPLHTVIIHFLRQISTAEYLLRAPSAVAGVLSVYFIYRWLIILGRRDVALYGALFLALHPYNLYYSQELRFYSLLTLFVILSMIAFERYLRDPTIGRGLVLGVTLTCASFAHFSALFLPVGFFVYLLVSRRLDRRYVTAGLVAMAVLLLVSSPWIYREIKILGGINVVNILTLPVEERLRGDLTLNPWSYPYTLYAFSVGYSFGPDLRVLHGIDSATDLLGAYWRELLLVAMLFGFLLIGGIRDAARRRRLALFLSIALTSAALITVIALLNIKVFNVRYLTVIFPVYLALIVYGLPRGRLARPIAIWVVCAFLVVSSWNYHKDPIYARDDIRSAVERIELGERKGDLILAINSRSVIDHYYRGDNQVREIVPVELGREEIDVGADRHLDRGGRVWYLRCRHWDVDPLDMVLKALEREGITVEEQEFPGVRLFLFEGMTQADERGR
jgi:4-amino-4-deoxy-L-arabinose transferase-like glycosyltransferase